MLAKMRFALRLCALLLALICIALAGAYLYLRQSLPTAQGEIALSGLDAPVEVLRDRHGIPHIYAASIEDAHFALGFVHAQDRLWQMEMSRRIGAGRLAEALGPGALETDRLLRTLGLRRIAAANLRHYDADARRLLDAYAAGVNAFLAGRPVLPVEFWIFGVKPEPWSPVDSVAWLKIMAWDLGGNWRSELLRLQLASRLPTARIQEFLPPYPGDAPLPLPDLKRFYGKEERPAAQLTRAAPDFDLEAEGRGSNSWVLAGSRTASGKPLLANDPHLDLTAPSVWYLAHMHAPGFEVIGGTLPGVPGVLLGRTDRIAWGFTNTGPDVQDLYLEKLDGAGGYLAPDGHRAFTVLEETIKVKGGEDEHLAVRVSRHGPVISDVSQRALDATPRGHALALAWTALAEDDLTLQAALKLSRVRDWPSFVEVGRNLHTPQQNVTYADVEGNIGFIAPGRVPIRKPDNELKGLAPAPGWDARYDWAGYIPYEALPRIFNPSSGSIVSANQKIAPPGYRYFITSEWQPPFRAARISQLLEAAPKHDRASFARMQADTLSLAVRELLPYFRKTGGRTAAARAAIERLSAWDGTMAVDRPEPLIAVAWWRELARAVYADELGDAFRFSWSPRAAFLTQVLASASPWCDDVRTARTETCDELLRESLDKALADLERRYGADMSKWTWGKAHFAAHRHRPLSHSVALAWLFDIRVPSAGDAYTVNVGAGDFNDGEPYASHHAPSLRAIYDLADPQASVFIQSAGQSGNRLSPHYRDFAAPWARGEYVPMITERSRLETAGVQRLVLVPRK
jgi:penicillin G amidase